VPIEVGDGKPLLPKLNAGLEKKILLTSSVVFRSSDPRIYDIVKIEWAWHPGRTASGELVRFAPDRWSSLLRYVEIWPRNTKPELRVEPECIPVIPGYELHSTAYTESWKLFVGIWRANSDTQATRTIIASFPQSCSPFTEALPHKVLLRSAVNWKVAYIRPALHVGPELILLSEADQDRYIIFAIYSLHGAAFTTTPPRGR
jgi:hypothetical protein